MLSTNLLVISLPRLLGCLPPWRDGRSCGDKPSDVAGALLVLPTGLIVTGCN